MYLLDAPDPQRRGWNTIASVQSEKENEHLITLKKKKKNTLRISFTSNAEKVIVKETTQKKTDRHRDGQTDTGRYNYPDRKSNSKMLSTRTHQEIWPASVTDRLESLAHLIASLVITMRV